MGVKLATDEMQNNPYPSLAAFRQDSELVQLGDDPDAHRYLFTRYEDVKAILTDSRFINDRRNLPETGDTMNKWYIPTVFSLLTNSIVLKDPPDHTRLKNLVHKAFTPRRIRELEGAIETMANDLLDAVADQDEIDFIGDFALPLPLNVICDLMGVPVKDRKKYHKWMDNNISQGTDNGLLDIFAKLRNLFGLNRGLKRLIQDHRNHPKDDLTTALVQAEADGDKLSHDELMSMLFIILFAGHETTVNLIGNGTLALLQHPEQFQLLKDNPDLLDSAIEEMLRYTNPVQHIAPRFASEDIEFKGRLLPQGTTVWCHIAAANRDETVFDNPDTFDITRTDNKHIAFGFGLHYCIGAPLARLEARVAFRTLLDRYPGLELAVLAGELQWQGAPALRGLASFPMRLKARERVFEQTKI